MKFQNLLLGIFLVLVSCATSNYDYFKLSKLEKKNYQLDLNSINYRLGNTILDKNNVSDLKIDRKKKIVFVKNKSELKFINLKKIADSTQNKNVNLAVIYGLPFAKGDFGKIIIEKSAIDSIKIAKIPLSDIGSEALVIKIKE